MIILSRTRVLALPLLAVLLLAAPGVAEINRDAKRAPDFTLKSSGGSNIKLSELRGRVVVVNFWATWCTPCKQELPYFNTLYRRYRNLGLEILGVNIDKVAAQASQMSAALGLSFPVLLDPSGKTSDLYQIRSMPTTFVVAKDGTLRHVHWGFGPDEPARYESEIRTLLKE
ncbi:MAG: TlpA family protein disulfide reductase [Nitrospirae bacterium]|nr:TlpA family protein disulfide reductase [Nitrospirota bacterium]